MIEIIASSQLKACKIFLKSTNNELIKLHMSNFLISFLNSSVDLFGFPNDKLYENKLLTLLYQPYELVFFAKKSGKDFSKISAYISP